MYRDKVITYLYCLVALVAIVTNLRIKEIYKVEMTNEYVVAYSPNTMGVAVYDIKSPNTMKCNLTTVNTIIENMIVEDYYYISKDFSEGNLMDIIITNGEDEHRILYNRRTRDFMTLSKPFLKNYLPLTYIHE